MFTLGDLKKTRVYRDTLQEGKLKGKLEGEKIGTQRGQVLERQQSLKQVEVRLLTRKYCLILRLVRLFCTTKPSLAQ